MTNVSFNRETKKFSTNWKMSYTVKDQLERMNGTSYTVLDLYTNTRYEYSAKELQMLASGWYDMSIESIEQHWLGAVTIKMFLD